MTFRARLVVAATTAVVWVAPEVADDRLTEPPENAYRRLMPRACGFPLTADDARRAVTDRDDFLGSATWFEAWILAAQIHGHLTKTFGPRWTNGHALTADDVARWAGGAGLDPAQLSSQLAARLTAK